MVNAVAVGAHLAQEEAGPFQGAGGVVDGGRFQVGLAEREAQLRQVGHLVDLPAGRLEQNGGAGAAVDVAQRPGGVGVERPRMRQRPGEVGVERRVEPVLAQLAQEHGAELRDLQRRRSQRDERLGARRAELLARGPRDPLRQHGQRAARLLELGERPPLALKHRQRRRMERIAGCEPAPQKLPRLGLGRGGVDRQPFGRQARGPLEAPFGIGLGDLLADPLAAQVLEQPPAHHLADLRFVVGDQVAGDAPDHLGDPVLPLLVPIGHLHLAARQAHDRGRAGGAGDRHRQVLQEGVERLGQAAVAVDEVEYLVEQQQHGRPGGGEQARQGLGSRRRGAGRGAERSDAPVAGKLARQIDPGRLPPGRGVPGVAHEYAGAGRGNLRQPGRAQQLGHPGEPRGGRPGVGKVVQRGEGMRLAAAELGDEGEDRRGIPAPAGQPPQHHPGVLPQRAREAGAGEELRRIAVVLRRRAGDHLLQRDGEFVRAERTPLPHFLAQRNDPIPRFQSHRSVLVTHL